MALKSVIEFDVRNITSPFVGITPQNLSLTSVLANPPLSMDSTTLSFYTLAIRGYVRSKDNNQTVTVREITKANLTVGDVVDLVFKKVP